MNYDRVDALLKEAGMSRRQLAIKCGIAPGTMSNWYARATKNIPFQQIQKMASVLNVPWYEIMGLDEIEEGTYARLPTIKEIENDDDVEIPVYDKSGEHLYTASYTSGKILSQNEAAIMTPFRDLNDIGQQKAIEAVETLAKVPEYRKNKRKKTP